MAQKSVIAVFSESQVATNYGAGMAIFLFILETLKNIHQLSLLQDCFRY